MNDLDAAKRAARQAAFARRHGLDAEPPARRWPPTSCATAPRRPGAIVSGFWPIGDEIDLRPLLHALHERGNRVALPVTPRRGEPLTFREWRPGDVLVPERFGTMRPIGDILVPDMLLIPLLAFDINRWPPGLRRRLLRPHARRPAEPLPPGLRLRRATGGRRARWPLRHPARCRRDGKRHHPLRGLN